MRIAVVNKTSSTDRNNDILDALEDRGLELVGRAMKKNGEPPELMYVQSGFWSALLLDLRCVDFVIDGCRTGQGFLNYVLQYSAVVCGHVACLDEWFFNRINAGNCISPALNQGCAWGRKVNLKLILKWLFSGQREKGFSAHCKETRQQNVEFLRRVSRAAYPIIGEIVGSPSAEILMPPLTFPGIRKIIKSAPPKNLDLIMTIKFRLSAKTRESWDEQ